MLTRPLIVVLVGLGLALVTLPSAAASHEHHASDVDDVLRDNFDQRNGLFRVSGDDADDVLDALDDSSFRSTGSLLGFPGDFSESRAMSVSFDQDVDLDEDTVLAAIVLEGRGGVDVEDVADRNVVVDRAFDFDRDVNFDRDDTLLWLALDGDSGFVDLDDARDIDVSADLRDEFDFGVDADFDDALLARALGDDVDFHDVADVDFDRDTDHDLDVDSDLDEDDVFSLLVLGR